MTILQLPKKKPIAQHPHSISHPRLLDFHEAHFPCAEKRFPLMRAPACTAPHTHTAGQYNTSPGSSARSSLWRTALDGRVATHSFGSQNVSGYLLFHIEKTAYRCEPPFTAGTGLSFWCRCRHLRSASGRGE